MTTINRTSVLQYFNFPVKRIVTALFLLAFLGFMGQAQALDLLKPFSKLFGGDKGIVIWEAPGQFVKIVDQDWDYRHRRAPENSHPANLKPEDLAIVLASIQAPDPEGTAIVPVFTRNEILVLAEKLSMALDRSQPNQDVVFGVEDYHDNVVSNNRRSTGCRVFYEGGDLNMIFGDVLQPVSSSSDNTSEYSKPHRAGRRMESNGRDIRVASGPGINYWQGRGIQRQDWIRVDVRSTIAAYLGPRPQLVAQSAPESMQQQQPVYNSMPRQQPAPGYELSAENRRLREELARERKRMSEGGQETPDRDQDYGAARAAPVSSVASSSPPVEYRAPEKTNSNTNQTDTDIVRRLTTLKSLYDKQLITSDEYDAKRKEILDKY